MEKRRRLDRTDCRILALTGIGFAAAVILCTHFTLAFGSSLDWSSQHFAIPDYFRKLFYQTGELFPSFAPGLGAGENIYYLSYYGLLSPVILFSYLLPFVKMSVYIQVSSAVLCWLGAALLYRFLRKRLSRRRSLLLMLTYLSASPIFLHAHRHIMFISYMPFLILAFEAVDMFFEGRHKWQLTLWCFLIIMTSWFFSVSALAAVTVYGIYRFLSEEEAPTAARFFKAAGSFALRVLNAVMMAGVLLLPTVHVLTSGRDKSNSEFTLTDLIPGLRFETFGLSPYSTGLGLAALLAVLLAVLSKDRARRFLGIALAGLSFLPLTVFVLNGTMYLDGKVLIPFIPLFLLLCSDMLEDAKAGRPVGTAAVLTAAAFATGLIFSDYTGYELFIVIGMCTDLLVLAGALLLYLKKHSIKGLAAALIAVPLVSAVALNITDPPAELELVKYLEPDPYEELCGIAAEDESVWRSSIAERRVDTVNVVPTADFYSPYIYSSVHHKDYNSFYFDVINNENEYRNSALTTRSQNPFFEMFISNRFLYSSSEKAPFGYEYVADRDGMYLYRNTNALPVGRVQPTLGEDVFDGLNDAEKMDALVSRVIVGTGGEFSSDASDELTVGFPEDSRFTPEKGGVRVRADESFNTVIPLGFTVPEDKLLVLELDCDNTEGTRRDVKMTINGVGNKLTAPDWKYYNNNTLFTYVIAPQEGDFDTLKVRLTAGDYHLSDIRARIISYPDDTEYDALILDKEKTRGDSLYGKVSCTREGYLMLSMPYDRGFELCIDGEKREYECVDKAFIGLPLEKGEHTVSLTFTAPLLREGKLLSCIGAALFLLTAGYELLSKRKNRGDKNGETETL